MIFPGMRGMLMLAGGVLMAIVGLVLLIACSNVAKPAAGACGGAAPGSRAAAGAGRHARPVDSPAGDRKSGAGRCGGALGFVFGVWGRDLLWAARPAMVANNFVELKIDTHVFGFALALSLVTGVVFGLMPAFRASRATSSAR